MPKMPNKVVSVDPEGVHSGPPPKRYTWEY